MVSENNKIHFHQGRKAGEHSNEEECLKSIKQKLAELSNIKNISFLLGSGASSGAIPTMPKLQERIKQKINSSSEGIGRGITELYENINSSEQNLEKALATLYAKKEYLWGIADAKEREKAQVEKLIEFIESFMYKEVNIDFNDCATKRNLQLYKKFYQKIALRSKELSRVNIFTTNYDLLNEKALDALNIDYNNGFGGGLNRVFNPARFRYTFSRKIDADLEKFEPLENMVYLYKLHGSISWVQEDKGANSLFSINEVSVEEVPPKGDKRKHVLIYPTPSKQSQSLGAPYADIIREFQNKLSQPNSALFIIGYSFSDEHINNIIYQSLASNSSMSIVIFGEHPNCPLTKIEDNRIYHIFGEDSKNRKIHYFKYIVNKLLPNMDENEDKKLLDSFSRSLNKALNNNKNP